MGAVLAIMLVIGDSLAPGIAGDLPGGGARVWYHLPDAIVQMETAGWSWSPVIVVELGIHAARGGDCLASGSAGVFRAYYGRVLDLAQAHAWRVVAVEIPALPFVDRYDAWDMNQIIHQEAAARGIPVATVFEPMLRCGAACLAADGHPNERGYQALAAQVEMALARSWPRLNGTWRVRR